MRFDDAANRALGLGEVATASELRLMSDLLVGQGRRRCDENRELAETAEHYLELITRITGKFGVHFDIRNEANSAARMDQTINNTVNWIAGLEQSKRENLKELAAALKTSAAPQEVKDQLLREVEDLEQDQTKGSGFLNKVASFCEKAKPVVEGIAGIAGPVAKLFAALHGMPPIPLGAVMQV